MRLQEVRLRVPHAERRSRELRGRANYREGRGIRCLAIYISSMTLLVCALTASGGASSAHHHHRPATPKAYAKKLVLHRWHSIRQWRALNEIVTAESNWDPCAYYPSSHDCGYTGTNSCGIPQRNPCPTSWHGRLFAARWAQVRWLISYVYERYGTPHNALEFRTLHGWY